MTASNPRKISESKDASNNNKVTKSHVISIPDREACDKLKYNEVYNYQAPPEKNIKEHAAELVSEQCGGCGGKCIWRFTKARFPILGWLLKYNVKTDLLQDIMAGITVGIMQVPQAMAYAFLAKVDPLVGLYTSLFPVLLYCLMGTSRHVSVGMYAIVCLMTGKVIEAHQSSTQESTTQYSTTVQDSITPDSTTLGSTTTTDSTSDDLNPLVVATVIAFFIGCIQVGLGILRLGKLTVYMSEVLISGYTCASAIFVFTSQIPDVLGITPLIKARSGPISFFYTWIDIFKNIQYSNWITIVIAVIAIVILYLNKEYLSPWFQKKLKIPLPMDLILIIIATAVSHFAELGPDHHVIIIGTIPSVLPTPSAPQVHLIKDLAGESVTIALVAITVNLSMAKVFAKKYNYEVDDNQELIAHGSANILGSFLSCSPAGVSLSRSSVMANYCKTQLAAAFASGLLLIVILWLTFLLKTLPTCILAAIIIVALKSMILQVKDLKKAWKLSAYDAAIWTVAFVATILLDVDNGLLVGIGFSLLIVLFRTHVPESRILGQIKETAMYEDVKRYDMAHETSTVKIFQFAGPLYFANRETFRDELYKIIPSPRQIQKLRKKQGEDAVELKCVIFDCSCWTYIDGSAISSLTQIIKDYEKLEINFLFASCKDNVIEVLERSELFSKIKSNIYPTIQDAIVSKMEESHETLIKRNEETTPPAYDNDAFHSEPED